jgi:hypothetical protein
MTIEQFHPYFKYVEYLVAIVGGLIVNKIFVTDPKLRAWLMTAIEESPGRVSIKLILGALMGFAVTVGFFIAVHFSINHAAPDYYLYAICGLITSLFGIREIGKVMSTKYSAPFNNQSNTTMTTTDNSNANGSTTSSTITSVISAIEKEVSPSNADDDLKKKWKDSGSTLSFEDWKTQQQSSTRSDT